MSEREQVRYTGIAILMHWLIAGAIVFQILLGWRMGWAPKNSPLAYSIFQLHKSVGITILTLSIARLTWRLFNRPPRVVQPRWEALAASFVHIGFYVILIGLPLTGWIAVSASPIKIPTLLYGIVPWPHFPGIAGLAGATKQVWYGNAKGSHELLVKISYALLALHLGAVIKHQVIDRDLVFGHMAPGARPGLFEPRFWLVGAVFLGIATVGFFYVPGVMATFAGPLPTTIPSARLGSQGASVPPASTTTPNSNAEHGETTTGTRLTAPVQWDVGKKSSVSFETNWSGQLVEGRFSRWTADIVFSPIALDSSHIKVSIDLSSVSTGDAQRDASLATDDWFDVANHPMATFTASRFRPVGQDRFAADGLLELRGVRRPLSLPFTLKIDGHAARVNSSLSIDRTAFGVGQGEWAATDSVPAMVKVDLLVVATSH